MKKKESEKIKNKRQEELETVSFMIEIFCRGKHGSDKGDLCEECKELMEYVKKKSAKLSYDGRKDLLQCL